MVQLSRFRFLIKILFELAATVCRTFIRDDVTTTVKKYHKFYPNRRVVFRELIFKRLIEIVCIIYFFQM